MWTPPHFWALAIARRDDYAKAGIPMLPVTHGVEFTRLQILLYTVLLVDRDAAAVLTGMSGLIYLAAALVLGGMFLCYALQLKARTDARPADADLPLLDHLPDVAVRGAAGRSLLHDPHRVRRTWPRMHSRSVIPWLLLVVLALIVYGSLYPFNFKPDAIEGGVLEALQRAVVGARRARRSHFQRAAVPAARLLPVPVAGDTLASRGRR